MTVSPIPEPQDADWDGLAKRLEGSLHRDQTTRLLYATDASAYREIPVGVAIPRNADDIGLLLQFAHRYKLGIIPRAAGTSLAGQVVGAGLVVDVSHHMNQILEFDAHARTITVQPGLIRDELNRFLEPHGLYFGPETSTANRATIGGMVGNNSCGSNSVVYGSTREHVLALEAYLADGSPVRFEGLTAIALKAKCEQKNLEGACYRQLQTWQEDADLHTALRNNGPKASIPRRNTGYALDLLLGTTPLPHGSTHPDQAERRLAAADFTRLVCGSEGTLAFLTAITLSLEPLPPPHQALLCAHFDSIDEALRGNLVALQHQPSAVELMDHYIFSCTATSRQFREYRFFLSGEPRAVLVVALARDTREELERALYELEQSFRNKQLGYAFPIVRGNDMAKVWALRKAGLGLLSNVPGDAKPVPVIEDTAVDVQDLPAYIRDFNALLAEHNLYAIHYAHAGTGELHLRPMLDLKSAEGRRLFRLIAEQVSALVKRYRGSLSGEHGDGRLRGEFLREQAGDVVFDAWCALKDLWDPNGLLNPGKIVRTPPMDSQLRYAEGQQTPTYDTGYRWDHSRGVVRAAEQCNGSGDCLKPAVAGGTMCPSYHATRREKDSTRARANALREALHGTSGSQGKPWEDPVLEEVLDLCLSCKGCTGECPSNVDMARLKSEWLFQHYRHGGRPLRDRLYGHANRVNEWGARIAPVHNALLRGRVTAPLIKRVLGVHPLRSLPRVHGTSFKQWFARHAPRPNGPVRGQVWLYADAFTNRLDVPVGQAAVRLLAGLGYAVQVAPAGESGRTYISKGMLDEARRCAEQNVRSLDGLVGPSRPLLGLEPSALLGFVDEFPDLVRPELEGAARQIAAHTFLLEDFLAAEAAAGRIGPEQFDQVPRRLVLHGHCHQKALTGAHHMASILALPQGHEVSLLPTGCCGMAGSFGYERDHYVLSQQIAELSLFPALRKLDPDTGIAAPGTSCRHQIKDGTGMLALHPVQWLEKALLQPDG